MYLSSLGVFLSLILIFSFGVIHEANGQEKLVTAKSIGFAETTIIEFHSSSNNPDEIDTFRIWLSSDVNFKSFKTERGWSGQKTPQGVYSGSSQDSQLHRPRTRSPQKTSAWPLSVRAEQLH